MRKNNKYDVLSDSTRKFTESPYYYWIPGLVNGVRGFFMRGKVPKKSIPKRWGVYDLVFSNHRFCPSIIMKRRKTPKFYKKGYYGTFIDPGKSFPETSKIHSFQIFPDRGIPFSSVSNIMNHPDYMYAHRITSGEVSPYSDMWASAEIDGVEGWFNCCCMLDAKTIPQNLNVYYLWIPDQGEIETTESLIFCTDSMNSNPVNKTFLGTFICKSRYKFTQFYPLSFKYDENVHKKFQDIMMSR